MNRAVRINPAARLDTDHRPAVAFGRAGRMSGIDIRSYGLFAASVSAGPTT